ncbi:MAG: VOC family protein [Dehalococcoidia bacterium]
MSSSNGEPVGQLAQVGIDVNDLDRAEKFWTALLGLKVEERGDPYLNFEKQGECPRLYIQKVPEKKTAKTRLHLDIAVEEMDSAVAKAEELGARKVQLFEEGDVSWTVMEDPDGNEFCLTHGE